MKGEPFTGPMWKPRPRILDQRDEKRGTDAIRRAVYREVDKRDGRQCRCCGRKGNPDSLTALGKIHRAHIVDASRGGVLAAFNLCSLCWLCHGLEHAKQLHFVGRDAGEDAQPPLRFEIHEAVVVEVFSTRQLPAHVRIIAPSRRLLRMTR